MSTTDTPRFEEAYRECLDDMGVLTRLEPLYAMAKAAERQLAAANADFASLADELRKDMEARYVEMRGLLENSICLNCHGRGFTSRHGEHKDTLEG